MLNFLEKQYPQQPLDDGIFDTADLVFVTSYDFAAPPHIVWEVLDSADAWKWLPFPGTGVTYPSPARGVGMVREMGSPFGWARKLWVEKERFWRYEPFERMTFGVDSGTWIQRLLVRHYGEDVRFVELPTGGTHLIWTVAVTTRRGLRWTRFFPAVWRVAYRANFGPPMRRRVRRQLRAFAHEVGAPARNAASVDDIAVVARQEQPQ